MYKINGKQFYSSKLQTALELFRKEFDTGLRSAFLFGKDLIQNKPGFFGGLKEKIKRLILTGMVARGAEGVAEMGMANVNPTATQATGAAANSLTRLAMFLYFRMHDQNQEEMLRSAQRLKERLLLLEKFDSKDIIKKFAPTNNNNVTASNSIADQDLSEIHGIDILIYHVSSYLEERFLEGFAELAESGHLKWIDDLRMLAHFFASSLIEILLLHSIDLPQKETSDQAEALLTYIQGHIVPPENHALYRKLPDSIQSLYEDKGVKASFFNLNKKFKYHPKDTKQWILKDFLLQSGALTSDGTYWVKTLEDTNAALYPLQRLTESQARSEGYIELRPLFTKPEYTTDNLGITVYLNELKGEDSCESLKEKLDNWIRSNGNQLGFNEFSLQHKHIFLRKNRHNLTKQIYDFNKIYTRRLTNQLFLPSEEAALLNYARAFCFYTSYAYTQQNSVPDIARALFNIKDIQWIITNIEVLKQHYKQINLSPSESYIKLQMLQVPLRFLAILSLELTYQAITVDSQTVNETKNFKFLLETIKKYKEKLEELADQVNERTQKNDYPAFFSISQVEKLLAQAVIPNNTTQLLLPSEASACALKDKLQTLIESDTFTSLIQTVYIPLYFQDGHWVLLTLTRNADQAEPINIHYFDPTGQDIPLELLNALYNIFEAKNKAIIPPKLEHEELRTEDQKALALLPSDYVMLKPILSQEIPDNFFHAIALCLNAKEQCTTYTAKYIRLICAEQAKAAISEKKHWLQKELEKNLEPYSQTIAKTVSETKILGENLIALEGQPKCEGRMLCEKFTKLNIYCLNVTEEKQKKQVSLLKITAGGEKSLRKMDFHDPNGIYIVTIRGQYYPLLTIKQVAYLKNVTLRNDLFQLIDRSILLPLDNLQGAMWVIETIRAHNAGIPLPKTLDIHTKRQTYIEFLHDSPVDIYQRELTVFSKHIQAKNHIHFIGAICDFKQVEKLQGAQQQLQTTFTSLKRELEELNQEMYFTAIALKNKVLFDKINQHYRTFPWHLKNKKGHTALHFAALLGSPEMFDALYQAAKGSSSSNEPVNLTTLFSDDGSTLLHSAAYGCNVHAVNILLADGFNIRQANNGILSAQTTRVNAKRTPLHLAAMTSDTQQTEVIKLLIQHKAEIEIQDEDGALPLHHLCLRGMPEISESSLELLMKNAPNPKKQVGIKDSNGRTVLHCAMQSKARNMITVLNRLLENGADVNAQDNNGNTLLHLAIGLKDLQGGPHPDKMAIIELLLQKGAKLMIANCNKQWPLHLALQSFAVDTIKLLLSYQEDFSIKDLQGKLISTLLDERLKKEGENYKARISVLLSTQDALSKISKDIAVTWQKISLSEQENIKSILSDFFVDACIENPNAVLFSMDNIQALKKHDKLCLSYAEKLPSAAKELLLLFKQRAEKSKAWISLKNQENVQKQNLDGIHLLIQYVNNRMSQLQAAPVEEVKWFNKIGSLFKL